MAQRFFDNTGVAEPYSDPNTAPASVLYLREAEPEAIWAERDNHIHRFLDEDGHWEYMDLGASEEEIKAAILALHPVGSYYFTTDFNNLPNLLFGGTWEKVENDRYLYDNGGSPGSIGGSSTVTLTIDNYPLHSHTIPSHTHTSGSHSHQEYTTHSHTWSHYHKYLHRHTISAAGMVFAMFASSNGWSGETFHLPHNTRNVSTGFGTPGSVTAANTTAFTTGTAYAIGTTSPLSSGYGLSGEPSSTTTNTTSSGSNPTVSLNPVYQRVFCWRRTA